MTATQIAGLLLVVLIAVALTGQKGSESVPTPAEKEVAAGAAQNIATGDNLGKAAAKAVTGPVKKELLNVGNTLIDEIGARNSGAAREYEQADPVLGGLLSPSVRLSEFAAKFILNVLALSLILGGIATMVAKVMWNIGRYM